MPTTLDGVAHNGLDALCVPMLPWDLHVLHMPCTGAHFGEHVLALFPDVEGRQRLPGCHVQTPLAAVLARPRVGPQRIGQLLGQGGHWPAHCEEVHWWTPGQQLGLPCQPPRHGTLVQPGGKRCPQLLAQSVPGGKTEAPQRPVHGRLPKKPPEGAFSALQQAGPRQADVRGGQSPCRLSGGAAGHPRDYGLVLGFATEPLPHVHAQDARRIAAQEAGPVPCACRLRPNWTISRPGCQLRQRWQHRGALRIWRLPPGQPRPRQ
mmetsp:Transcript_20951/g.65611  ORF Transcript_20951/g.65611 Transcript_20951/m.65611 type:complete len:263 (+) Transcript_20951:1005-1793(+)